MGYRTSEQFTYPAHLIPQKDLKIISPIDPTHFLGKWVDSDVQLKESDGKLSPEAIDIVRLTGYSTNKIPSSQPLDLKIAFTVEKDFANSNYTCDWKEGEDGVTPPNNHWEVIENRQLFFIRISDIDGFSGQYFNPPDRPDKKFSFTVKVVHKPTKTNYWHFEFYVSNEDGAIERLNTKGWRKTVSSSIVNKIQEVAVFEPQ